MQLPPAEDVLAEAAEYLIRKGQGEAARVLLSCSLYLYEVDVDLDDRWDYAVNAALTGPDEACRILGTVFDPLPTPISSAVFSALQGQLPVGCRLHVMVAHPGVNTSDPMWRSHLLEKAHGAKVDNQALEDFAGKIVTWNGLRFRSESERCIAAALDRAGALYLPNCRARLGVPTRRQNLEADFLVCHEGKWGILEVDREPFHPPARKAHEDVRDRLFKQHGVRVVEHFDAAQCFNAPDEVVKQFLAILKQV